MEPRGELGLKGGRIDVGLEDHEPGAEVALVERNHEPLPVERVAAHVPVVAECALHAAILIEAPVADGGAAHVAEL